MTWLSKLDLFEFAGFCGQKEDRWTIIIDGPTMILSTDVYKK